MLKKGKRRRRNNKTLKRRRRNRRRRNRAEGGGGIRGRVREGRRDVVGRNSERGEGEDEKKHEG